MHRFLELILKYRSFLVFLLLEIFCFILIVKNNSYQRAAYVGTASKVVGNIVETKTNIINYFRIKETNNKLVKENARLKNHLYSLNYLIDQEKIQKNNSPFLKQFDFEVAKVVNKTLYRFNNYITINKGNKNGIKKEMGVISAYGIVGKVRSVSDHYASVVSILHAGSLVSSQHKPSGTMGTVKWNGTDPSTIELLYIPMHVSINQGDSIVTSGYNAIFPPDTPIGLVKEVRKPKGVNFQHISVSLLNDFHTLTHVYVIKNTLVKEKDSLEGAINHTGTVHD